MSREALPYILQAGDHDKKQTTSPRHAERTAGTGAAGDTQPWTAARCQRLLRQLQSRLEALRKLHFKGCTDTTGQSKRLSSAQDLAEEPQRANKRVRYTYGQKRQSCTVRAVEETLTTPPRSVRMLGAMKANNESPTTGQVVVPTPLWRRIREQHSSPRSTIEENGPPAQKGSEQSLPLRLLEQLRRLQSSVPSSQYRIYEAIFHWLASLLRSTSSKPDEPSRKSLLGMCLRKIPACVAEIEAWERHLAKEQGNGFTWTSSSASTDLYGELEAFGSNLSGWRPLKLMVLSHAIHLLSKAIEDRTIELPFACLLSCLCTHWGRTEEASTLMLSTRSKILDAYPEEAAVLAKVQGQTLRDTIEWMTRTTTSGSMFGCLTVLMKERRLPASWFSSQGFKQSWLRALEVIAAGKGGPSAVEFLCTSMELLSKPGDNEWCTVKGQKQQTLVSVVGAVVAATLTVGTGVEKAAHHKKIQGQRRLLFLLEKSVRRARMHPKRRGSPSEGVFFLMIGRQLALTQETDLVLKCLKRQAANELRTTMAKDGAQTQTQYDQVVRLACSVAQCCRRTHVVAGHDAVAEVCSMMDGLSSDGWSGHTLRSDVAFLLAQKTKDLRDLAHAESLAAIKVTQDVNTVFSGWRWEEGISEWVQLSPTDGGEELGGISSATRRSTTPPSVFSAAQTHRREARKGSGQDLVPLKDCLRSQRGQNAIESHEQALRKTRSSQVGQSRKTSTQSNQDQHDKILSPRTNSKNRHRGIITSGSSSRKSSVTTSPANIASTGAGTKRPAYGALGHGKENDFGSTSRRSISDKATARVRAGGGDQQLERRRPNWTRARATLAPLSQGLAVDTDWDELM